MENTPQNTALLVMDMQTTILSMLPNPETIKGNVGAAIAHARNTNTLVIYVVVGFRQGGPEISINNKGFAASKSRFGSVSMEGFMKVDLSVVPLEGEIIVTKRRVSAFTGSDLEVVLRSKGIQHVVLTGVATSGVVLSTIREAADKDYRITVIADCCADSDEVVHRVLITKVFPRQADVLTLDEWVK